MNVNDQNQCGSKGGKRYPKLFTPTHVVYASMLEKATKAVSFSWGNSRHDTGRAKVEQFSSSV